MLRMTLRTILPEPQVVLGLISVMVSRFEEYVIRAQQDSKVCP